MGEVVRVKDGFARNYLLPKQKALRATKENRSRFENMKVELETRNIEQRGEAEKIAKKLDGKSFTVVRQAAEGGQLYGSVTPRDLAALVTDSGFLVSRAQIALHTPIKSIGLHKVPVLLHPEVEVSIAVAVGRNADEVQRILRGEDVTRRREEEAEASPEQARAHAEAFFEPEAVEARPNKDDAPAAQNAEAATQPKQ
jgi:large subunit ribosomal protein L9